MEYKQKKSAEGNGSNKELVPHKTSSMTLGEKTGRGYKGGKINKIGNIEQVSK